MTNRNDIEQLFKAHYAQMYRLAAALLHDDDLARDIVHDVFASLLDGRPSLPVNGWYLLKAVRNRSLNHIRDCEIHQRIANRYFLDNEEYDSEKWPDDETIARIYSLIHTDISPQAKRVIELRFSEGMPFAHIGAIMGISETDGDGVIRTIKQPMGTYTQGRYGIKGTARFLDRSLVLTGNLSGLFNHNGKPYDVNHFHIYYTLQMAYYLKNRNFGLTYISTVGSWDGMMNGIRLRDKDDYYLQAGRAKSNLKISAVVLNIGRWNWRSTKRVMNSEHYSTDETLINGNSHALVKITATYTFGFGKKVGRDNEPQISGSAASGILK